MKIVIFAGGSGRRLWPISRQHSPKQFESIIGSQSTVQLAVDRVIAHYGAENIFISTNARYYPIIREQLPQLPGTNLIAEPVRRDLAPAVGLAMAHLAHSLPAGALEEDEPVAILWGDNYMSDVPVFQRVLATAEQLLRERKAEILFIGETPRFANNNLGWIGLGPKQGELEGAPYFAFESWTYRPALAVCQQMFASGRYVWNTGYFVTTIGFVRSLYREHRPGMSQKLAQIQAAIGQPHYEQILNELYPTLESVSFDDAILTHVSPAQALVLHGKMGWSDPGTLYALKEAINPDTNSNAEHGLVLAHQSRDCLLYNYEEGKLLAVIGLEGMVVVNTEDAILVVHKDQVPLVRQMVDSLEGTELEKYS
ncbi:MAG: mannose-1-phosphate guanylyltransferase [Ardenticatenaceae bacterium]|nr:mannose-1-phosphate guanylyltransferase [Anaerolineales bacterium]MCB8916444.1 mannose-1-phosphate guanylyltransferase [Ardenticatenaceae bacterium]